MIGRIFGDLTVVSYSYKKSGKWYMLCKCRCGHTKDMRDDHLKSGVASSCGLCGYKESHPFAHKSWDSMRQRCNNPNAPDYPRYGGRGIKICKEWDRFIDFLDDMGDPPTCALTGKRFTLDRIDNDGNYTKENCRWANSFEQNRNKSSNILPATLARRRNTDHYRRPK